MRATQEVTVFLEHIPNGYGLRLYSENPAGVFISSRKPDAAKSYFSICIQALLMKNGILKPEPGGTVMFVEPPHWDDIETTGSGTMTIGAYTKHEVTEILRTATPMLEDDDTKLHEKWWTDPLGNPFCYVVDNENAMDRWLFEKLTQHVERVTARLQ